MPSGVQVRLSRRRRTVGGLLARWPMHGPLLALWPCSLCRIPRAAAAEAVAAAAPTTTWSSESAGLRVRLPDGPPGSRLSNLSQVQHILSVSCPAHSDSVTSLFFLRLDEQAPQQGIKISSLLESTPSVVCQEQSGGWCYFAWHYLGIFSRSKKNLNFIHRHTKSQFGCKF